jgi:hypothetical protein
MSAVPRGTYRIVLTHEQSGCVAFDHAGLDAKRVEQLMGFLAEAAPLIKASQGASELWAGLERIRAGFGDLQKQRRAAASRGRR